ncbi:MAG: hypothetical protein B6I19_00840 [Bacteroidetes bacterium 4572_114]|nr:MAG: hypothetical protein B6I19_00840 [Bacteroidetes bacterium 4572_114]
MKSKLLPFSLIIFILGFTTIILTSGWVNNFQTGKSDQGNSSIKSADEYLQKMRSNQVTGKIDPQDVLKARQQIEQMNYKSGNGLGLNWEEMGPDNAPGRVRAVIFDENDASGQTIIVAGVTGGLWKTTNLGATWNKINEGGKNLSITSLTQAADGTIYAGTGEFFCTTDDTYYGGLVGQGMYKSTDGDVFEIIPETVPDITQDPDTVDWAYINNIVVSPSSQRVFAATNTGLFYSNDGVNGWQKAIDMIYDTVLYDVDLAIDSVVHCDSYEIVGNGFVINNPQYSPPDTTEYSKTQNELIHNIIELGAKPCTDVAVNTDGLIYATFDNLVFRANESDMVFKNLSANPNNPYEMEREFRAYTTTLTVIDTLGNTDSRTIQFTDTTDYANAVIGTPSPLALNPGRTEVEISLTGPAVVYATCTGQFGFLDNVYFSEDNGDTWIIIFPGSSSLEIFDGTGCYNNTLAVFPDDPFKILVGGNDMWLGERYENTNGYYIWGAGPVTSPFNVPSGHHKYAFRPGSNSQLVVATDNGITLMKFSASGNEFTNLSNGLNITQCYTVGPSGARHELLCGTQGDGTQYISGHGNTPEYAEKIFGQTGGYCAISLINPDAFVYSRDPGVIVRSEDKGQNTSVNFAPPASNIFMTPILMWESFEDYNSRDSVTYYNVSDSTIQSGKMILCRSANFNHPFYHMLTEDLADGDSLMVQDIIQSKLFNANAGNSGIQMTKGTLKFGEPGEFWKIADAPGFPTCISASADANFLFVGTDDGKLYRVSNIALAYDSLRADIGSSACIIATDELQIPEFQDRFITSVSVDPQNPEHLIVTLGNYGNEDYIYRTTNALDSLSLVIFENITGNLPHMPVYSSIIEMNQSNVAVIGTEYGVYTTSHLGEAEVEWTMENSTMGAIPVFQIKQQTVYKDRIEIPTTPPQIYPEILTYGSIYIATYGRGVFRDETYRTVGIEEMPHNNASIKNTVSVYPNPVSGYATVAMEINTKSNVTINIYDLTGKLAKTIHSGNLNAGIQELNIDCSDLKTGTYVIRVFAGEDSGSTKFIVN